MPSLKLLKFHTGFLVCLVSFCSLIVNTQEVLARTPPVVHHTLKAALHPDQHTIQVVDTINLPQTLIHSSALSFRLNPRLTITSLALNGQPLALSSISTQGHSQSETAHLSEFPPGQMMELSLPRQENPDTPLALTVAYEGQIHDPPQTSGGLRFVKPDETNGHIGTEGIYLTSETFWHPTWENVLYTYELIVTLPEGWEAVTQDKPLSRTQEHGAHTTTWHISTPSEALTIAANRFIVNTRQWQGLEIATYLFPEEAPLASQYLDATIRYLELYTELLGPFPFSTFAVAENFFPSGLGMPGFTLLGQGVMRRGYTQPYSLGHEIVHSWFGNSVFNDFSQGNWVEGLTTYLTNYYYDEATGNLQDAFNTRRRMHHEYNVYTTPADDYPIRQFHHKEMRKDNAVGYQKTALVFHMLRQEIGDQAFFQSVRQIIKEGTGQYIEWRDLERIFSRTSEKDLGWFFAQWVSRTGAPKLEWVNLEIQEDRQRPGQFVITGTVTQPAPPYRISLPIQIEMEDGQTHSTTLHLSQARELLIVPVPARPTKLLIDSQHHVLRRLERDQLPPILNLWETDSSRTVILPHTSAPQEEGAYASLIQRLKHQPDLPIISTDRPDYAQPGSYLTVGAIGPQMLETHSHNLCKDVVQVSSQKVTILDHHYASSDMAFLISCPHPDDPKHTLTFFFGLSPEAMTPVARLLFFYGWDSYLVFQQGRVVARGLFDPVHSAHEIPLPAS